MPGAPFLNRLSRRLIKSITFDAVTNGVVATPTTVFTVVGSVRLIALLIRCTTALVSVSNNGTIALGTAGNTGALISATTVGSGTFTANKIWQTSTVATGAVSLSVVNFELTLSLILTYATNNISSGVLEFAAMWEPGSSNGLLS